MKNKTDRIHVLIKTLNISRNDYYNGNESSMSDSEYDKLFDELSVLEKETGLIMSNSPTNSVGYIPDIKSELEKVEHKYPLLSLDKTKDEEVVKDFTGNKNGVLMWKADGLTICLEYRDGSLFRATTRGDGEVGEDITHNAKVFQNIPLTIPNKETVTMSGEAVITYQDFAKINAKLPLDDRYSTPRNLASGSVRQLNSELCKKRFVRFLAFNVLEGMKSDSIFFRLKELRDYGFETVDLYTYSTKSDSAHLSQLIESLKKKAADYGCPIDGLVMMFDDIEYGKSLGKTGHHFKNGIALKFEDEVVSTTLESVEWSMGKTGVITPVAIFDPVELDGTEVGRASLHNVSILQELELGIGDEITVYKANMIIPQIEANITRSNTCEIPKRCPVCGAETEVKQDNKTKVLVCTNDNCQGKLLKLLSHFISKKGMDINQLSEATLQKFVDLGWLNSLNDVYLLENHYKDMLKLEGFGKKSVDKLLLAIEKSKTVKLESFLAALSIGNIGKTASKVIAKHFNYSFDSFIEAVEDDFDFTLLDDFGVTMNDSIYSHISNNITSIKELSEQLTFMFPLTKGKITTDLAGTTFVITGKLNSYENRDTAKEEIESLGGKVVGSVSKNTNYLVNNDINSNTGKNKKAKELGVSIINEEQLIAMLR